MPPNGSDAGIPDRTAMGHGMNQEGDHHEERRNVC